MAEIDRHGDTEANLQAELENHRTNSESFDRQLEVAKAENEAEISKNNRENGDLMVKIKLDSDARENEYKTRISDGEAKIENYIAQVDEKDQKIGKLDLEISEINAELAGKDALIAGQTVLLDEANKEKLSQTAQIAERDEKMAAQTVLLTEANKEKTAELAERDGKIAGQKDQITKQTSQIGKLQSELQVI